MGNTLKTFKRIVTGAAVAGAAGYVAGILTAPKSGRETRKEFTRSAKKGVVDVEEELTTLQSELSGLAEEARDRGEDLGGRAQKEAHKLVDTARDSKQKVQGVLDALKQGKASDKDLAKAISDAKHAIDHVKDYLKK